MKPAHTLLLSILVTWGSVLGCAKKTVLVPRGAHRPAAEEPPVVVRTPPPPAQIEVMPLRRNEDCFYLDGYYVPDDGEWRWEKGMWVLPPKGCYYAAPRTSYERVQNGTALVYRAGVWLPKGQDSHVCPAAKDCPDPFVVGQ